VSAGVAKELLIAGEVPDYVDESDYLAILNCHPGTPGFVLGIWITKIDPRSDRKDGYCKATDCTAVVSASDVLTLLRNSYENLRTDLWMSTSTSINTSPKYFSKRLAGFLITSCASIDITNVRTLYDTHDSLGQFSQQILTSNLPLSLSGGLVGVLRGKPSNFITSSASEGFFVIFGYPTGLRKPFAVVSEDFDQLDLLNHDLQQYTPFEMEQKQNCWSTRYERKGLVKTQSILVTLATVMEKGMLFIQLHVDSKYDWSN
jgi:hypothetical protein